MEEIKEFLESSSINGLALISSTRRFSRLFWILVVLGGFTGAIYMILESIENWRKNPISTTFNTKPIAELTFPNVTVCPPKGLYLNLNNDIREGLTRKKNVKFHTWGEGSGQNWVIFTLFLFFSFMSQIMQICKEIFF